MEDDRAAAVSVIRRFSRFYTRRIGVLQEGLLGSELSLTEGRIIYEIAHLRQTNAARLGSDVGLDAGYLSRVLRGLQDRGLIDRRPSETDGRQSVLSLSATGRQMFAMIDARSQAEVGAMLEHLSMAQLQQLVCALETAEDLLGGSAREAPRVPYMLRPHRPGDLGWVVHRQAVLYAQEYGWDGQFEAMLADIAAHFISNFNPSREASWIAEREGAVVGAAFLVHLSDDIAKLRMLYVEPDARGLGIGRRLVEECIRFARQAGYQRITLWTNDILTAARRIYQQAGFHLVAEERHHSFGHDLVGENWQLDL